MPLDASVAVRSRGPGRPIGSDSAQTRARILDAARDLIATRGYPATTFAAIAGQSGLSRTALHYYFGSLDAIYQTLMTEASVVVMRCIATANLESNLPNQLGAYVAEFGRTSVSDRATVALLVGSRLASSQAPPPVHDPAIDVRVFLAEAVDGAMARGELPVATSTALLVDLLYSLLWGIGFYAGFVDDADRLEAITDKLGYVFRFGLLEGDA